MMMIKIKNAGPGGAVSTGRVPATNLFQEGTLFDLYVYVSEQKEFGEFHVSIKNRKSSESFT
jgi:hypothetical protein